MESWMNSRQVLLDQYLDEIGSYEMLSPGHEMHLASLARKGNLNARNRMIVANLRFVVWVAREYQGRGLPLCDLIGFGNLGLIDAVNHYDETRGVKFITYAVWWIRREIRNALATQGSLVPKSSKLDDLIQRISQVTEQFEKSRGIKPTEEDIASELGISTKILRNAQCFALPVKSLDGVADHCHPDEKALENIIKKDVATVIKKIPKREATVLRLYFGMGEQVAMSLREIGRLLNLSAEGVRWIKKKALQNFEAAWKSRRGVHR